MNPSFRIAPLAGAILVACSSLAHADPGPTPALATLPVDLDRIEVRAEREGYGPQATSTATKTDTDLEDVPQAVTIISEQLIQDQGLGTMTDVLRLVPGVGVAQGEGHRDAPIFRGNTSTSDMFVDGIRDDVQYIRDIYNVERVEVLKGPNAMVFGRGGVGGVINRVTKVADGNTYGELGVQVGSFDRARGVFDFGQPITAGSSFRVTGLYEDSESFRDGFELERYGINPTFAFGIGDATSVVLGYEYFSDERVADRGIPSFNGRPVDVPLDTFFGSPDLSYVDAEVNAFSALVEHQFSPDVVLRNRTRIADYSRFYQNVYPGNVTANADGELFVDISAYNNNMDRENVFNQTDLVMKLEGGAIDHTLLVGAEFGRQETGIFRTRATLTGPSRLPISDPRYVGGVDFTPRIDLDSVAKVAAVYVQDQIEFSPQWQAVVGLRYDHFEVEANDPLAPASLSTRDDLWSPRVGVIWQPVEALSLYASYTTASLPRVGEQLSSIPAYADDGNASLLDPEEFASHELGMKWFVQPDLMFTAAVYQLDRSNVVVSDPLQAGEFILFDGQTTEGVELSLAGEVTDRWSVIASYAYQDGTIKDPVKPDARPAQLPRHSAAIWNRFDLDDAWGFGLGAVYRDDVFATTSNKVTLNSFARVDAAVYYTLNPRLRFQLNVENLFDTDYFASAHNDNNLMPGSPRAVYLGANFSF
ncbi:TonB-dependent receptor [Lysobacter sp. A3-1-A15]|uniref:TonB-dependent receptor n=1 Tax=Novilysobacter viscosus TaxID=3098602 RepID=UPI002ED98148